tara:strand:+ start:1733 stop:2080 length:348 start_codon:yes stop_codon:yes gene_type:complete
MAHYARVTDGIVTSVIVAEAEFFDDFVDEVAGEWMQTSYNTLGGVHLDGGTPLRKNYAGVGSTYDATRDAFIAPQPYPSWTLVEDSCLWEAPTTMPDDGKVYIWNEETTSWVEDI